MHRNSPAGPALRRLARRALWPLCLLGGLAACGAAPPPLDDTTAPATTAPSLPNGNERLGPQVTPLRYRLDLRVDPALDAFRGRVEIDVTVAAPTREIRLHGTSLTIRQATVGTAGAAPRIAQAVSGPHGGLALRLDTEQPAGPATLVIDYQAPLGEIPESLYRVREGDAWYAFTQFEPLEARGAFPCFDQPEFKVPFAVTLRVPTGQRAFANTPETTRRLEEGLSVVSFAETPPLPTYLIAFAIGPLETLDAPAGAASVPLRVITTAGRAREAAYALEQTPRILASLEKWFGTPYPFAKLDLVAVPNFSSGAMENPGLVTFRERLLLLDAQSPAGARAGMFGVVAHELAHMWFGDLVTMRWWDDLWLNEAFATWMATRTVQEIAPEFESEVDQAANASGVYSQDAQPSTRSIRQPIGHGGDVYNAFDGITYGKGSLVLGMLESWLGAEVFRDGVRRYLQQHARGNATTADLVAALTEVSKGAPVATFVDAFTTRPGTPMVQVEVQCEAGKTPALKLRQARFRPLDGAAPEVSPWSIPMCVRFGSAAQSQADTRQCFLFDAAEAVVPLTAATACPAWLHPNADERGYYRWTLPTPAREALFGAARERLTLRERVVIPAHTGAWLEAGLLPIDQAAEIYLSLGGETHRTLLSGAIWGLRSLFKLNGEAPDPRLTGRLRAAFGAHLARLGLQAKPGENPDVRFLRNTLIWAFADMTEDPALLDEARRVTAAFVAGPSAMDSERAGVFVPLAATVGDATLWTHLRELLAKPLRAVDRDIVLRALGSFRDPALLARSYGLATDDTLRAQDIRGVLSAGGSREATRRAAWTWLKGNYDAVVARIGDKSTPSLPFIGAGLCSPEGRADVEAFFGGPRGAAEGTERNLKLTLESIDRCMAFKRRHEEAARAWLNRRSE
jgi:alanyl aminopeptidase